MNSIRFFIYNKLVNKQPGIQSRYNKIHDGSTGIIKVFSWFYLLWLNIAYYFFFMRFLGEKPESQIYESKKLPITDSESCINYAESGNKNLFTVDSYVENLEKYDVISFDIFDTLIFRPFSTPIDLFRIVGERLGVLEFANIRARAELDSRVNCNEKKGHMEVTLKDIYDNLEKDLGLSSELGQKVEIETERELCYANPFMLEVWNRLIQKKKRIVVVSDMYLSAEILSVILTKNGFKGYEKLYVSSEFGKNKASGSLFKLVKKEWSSSSIIHIGDNERSDKEMAVKNGVDGFLYPKTDRKALLYRPYDMSVMVGSAYRGIVSNHIYNGLNTYSMEYEYGYIYGGLFTVGYCAFIHEYCKNHDVDKLLFLSRDGDILKQVYELLYPDEKEKLLYVYWSRKAATILMADDNKHDYFRRFISHKENQKYSFKKILKSMGLQELSQELDDCYLTDKNSSFLKSFIESKWEKVLSIYKTNQIAAQKYYKSVLKNTSKAVALDIGWAGSGAISLSHLIEKVWNIPCSITGIVAGTNTLHNNEPDASEPFLQSGKLVSYLYSQSHNRDLLKKHNPNKDYNVFWELLLSSPTPQFAGFFDGKAKPTKTAKDFGEDIYIEDLDITLRFGKYDANKRGINEIQRGIIDFATQYKNHFKAYPYMLNISGRDAYAPMLLASSHNERYLKAIEKKFEFDINVD